MASIFDRMASGMNRLAHAWNVFSDNDQNETRSRDLGQYGSGYGSRPDRRRMSYSNDRSIIAAIYTRLAIDVATFDWYHARVDEHGYFVEPIKSGLNECLTLAANIDQTARAFKQDIALTMFEKGAVAIVPIDTSINPDMSGAFDINTMRAGEIVQWYPQHVMVRLWNDEKGRYQDIPVLKKVAAIIENPFYQVMNEPNSTLQRLIRKLNILDSVDEATSSGKLDILVQLPYTLKSEAKKEQAEDRRKEIEAQLRGSKYGIAYIDGAERITQLNRPAENNLLNQVQYLEEMLFGQLGLSKEIFTGDPDESVMLNYYNRTIEPVLVALTEAMKRSFLTKTGRTQGQSIVSFRDPFKLVPVGQIAEIADKFSRNEIMSSNEIRSKIGLRPSKDPKADQLRNSNMPQPAEEQPPQSETINDPFEGPTEE